MEKEYSQPSQPNSPAFRVGNAPLLFSVFIHPKTRLPFARVDTWSSGRVHVLVPRSSSGQGSPRATNESIAKLDAAFWEERTRAIRSERYGLSYFNKLSGDENGIYFLIDPEMVS